MEAAGALCSWRGNIVTVKMLKRHYICKRLSLSCNLALTVSASEWTLGKWTIFVLTSKPEMLKGEGGKRREITSLTMKKERWKEARRQHQVTRQR